MRILSGMRPTGRLHLGNYLGALTKWIELQDSDHEMYFAIVDWHGLTTDYQDLSSLQDYIEEMLIDWLACGLDPERSVLFLQSDVKQHAELHLLLSMATPLGWLERVPTFKELQVELSQKDLRTYGFLGYPVLQAADIMLYRADGVPVGDDQLPHLELTREIIRRMHHLYKTKVPEPKSLLSNAPRINGTDGRKMSKSYDNAIYLSDSKEQVEKSVKSMKTDPARARLRDPGNPKDCNLYPLHEIFSSEDEKSEIQAGCTSAKLGCMDCKLILLKNLESELAPIRQRRWEISKDKGHLRDVLKTGREKAQTEAEITMVHIREKMNLLPKPL